MEWFYALDGQQHGPVDAARLRELFETGVVHDGSLVWRHGLDGWREFRFVRAELGGTRQEPTGDGEGLEVCVWSGERRPQSEMLRYGNGYVARDFKEAFLASLQESGRPLGDLPFRSGGSLAISVVMARAWRLLCRSFWLVVPLKFAVILPAILLYTWIDERLIPDFEHPVLSFGIDHVIETLLHNILIGVVGAGAVVLGFDEIWHGRRAMFMQALRRALRLWPKLVVAAFLYQVATDLATFVLIIPGVILMFRWTFVIPVAVLEPDTRGYNALGRSFDLTRGHFWQVAGCLLVALMPTIAVCLALLAGVLAGVIGMLSIGDESASTIADHWLTFVIVSLVVELALLFVQAVNFVLYKNLTSVR
jgi:hypothetical protein